MDYQQALLDLRNKEIDEIKVGPESFSDFQRAWSNFPYQNTVKGIASKGGFVTYIRTK